ncbi:MAG: hypothetical protein ABR986_02245 [Methanomassiliicoccales archaeon]|jgi:uncharacterized membrane protein (Fun14 family)
MSLIDELVHFVTNGSIAGLPPLVVMLLPFIIGLIVGFFAIKFLKIALIIIVVLAVVIYFGFYSMDIPALQQMAQQYGSSALHLGALLIGVLPLTFGFIIGAGIGFIFG